MHPTATPRKALRALAWAAVPALLIAGCSSPASDSGADGNDDGAAAEGSESAPEPEPVRFADLPSPCAVIGEDTIDEIVPKADPKGGSALTSNDTSLSGTCLWSGLKEYQYRSLTVSLRRFESDLSLGSGDERAQGFIAQQVEEITGDGANSDIAQEDLAGTGDSAITIAYNAEKDIDDDTQDFRQQRVVVRTGNVVVTVDYAATGLEGDDMPGAKGVRERAETAAAEAVDRLDATAQEDGGDADEESGADTDKKDDA
ncbi:DUF3558 domain-containing protein [Streptomyces sp. XM4011]|uniref:DUF3558 domain-containing protein n=1 Tax=Streptomyces sp. XM4011 TaxID=2929780 RepID=UPI001FF8BD23|nr:DUF3558 domain-containing protein [Streptomyces sp. XM4011]MCK1813922.1 DUF3558 domain-containing protein [Streptomyces sp. XM4011]